ncbi:hypothetical protein Ciccas_009054 [Cichlidogyrus casuarinus]|uniref:Uncharacterized protein n=1 Tax=Cichlidogyrus casuarinus TaxID=1844966 RepID=A0ABD2PYU5_9PLAT
MKIAILLLTVLVLVLAYASVSAEAKQISPADWTDDVEDFFKKTSQKAEEGMMALHKSEPATAMRSWFVRMGRRIGDAFS